MSKRLIVAIALALVAGLAFSPAYAEVQNVKVSGDILMSGVARRHFGLTNSDPGDNSVLKQNFIMTQTRVRIDADLTDNVSATVRLINERIWNGQNDTNASGSNSTEIDLDLAYVTLKEFLYSPLTLTVGRQEIKFGNGLIIGESGAATGTTNIPTDLSERSAFDAIRATLDYDPLVIDLVYAQVKQNNTIDRNTVSLTGINATYSINSKVNISGYYWFKKDNNIDSTVSTSRADKVNTIGTLISATPIENLSTSLEAAYQFGKNTATANQKNHDAWALQAMADYTFANVKMTPMVGASYTYLSGGESNSGSGKTSNNGWDPMFYSQRLNNIVYALLPMSNMSALNIKASCKPVEDVTISAVYGYYDVAKANAGDTLASPGYYDSSSRYLNTTYTGKSHLGDALDATVTYDYTEDVQFGLTGGIFRAGNAISVTNDNKVAQQLIGSMKVTF
ncbi:MAG: alginate export family protein [Candidatus Omnitrophica bacterium]|nr:alginate export family protein [Candidatus Omnitrophota bacterium]MDD5771152.1 alginate export family protein [Candidatus Omnitrophota bacterium]